MINLTENAIRYMYDLNNCRCMIYPVDRLVQILELKPFKGEFFSATLSDGTNFNRSFLLNKKFDFGVYDVIKIENIMKSFDPKELIIISRCVKIQNETRPIGNPFEYPCIKTPEIINKPALIKGEKKIIKVQNIFLKRNQEIKKENPPKIMTPKSINEMSVKKEPLQSVSNNKDNEIKPNLSSEIEKEISKRCSSNKKKSSNEFDGEIILDLNDLNNIIEDQIELTGELLAENNIGREAINNTQEYRLTQEINHSEVKRNIDEINRIEENKSNILRLPTKNEDNLNNMLAIKYYEEFNSFENYSQIGVNEGVDTVDNLIEYDHRHSASNINISSPISFAKNDLAGHFRMPVPGRTPLESSKSKPTYMPLNLITGGMTNFVVKIRIVKIIRIMASSWNFEIVDESKHTGNIKLAKKFIEKYRAIFNIYEVFEISDCSTIVEKYDKNDKIRLIILEITENTKVTHIKDNCDKIGYTEQKYVLIDNLQTISTNIFSMMVRINKIEYLKSNKIKKGYEAKNIYLTDLNLSKIRLEFKNDVIELNLKEGDIIYLCNPTVRRTTNEIYLEGSIFTVIFVNPVCPTVDMLRGNLVNPKIEYKLNSNLIKPIKTLKTTRIKLKELEEFSKKENFDTNQQFLIKATIVNFNPKLFHYYDGCPKCCSKYKIDIKYNECEKCKIKFEHPKTYLHFIFYIQDCTGKQNVSVNQSICSKFLSYICKGIGLNKISAEEYKRLSIDYNNNINVEEIDKIILFLKKSEFYFKVKINKSEKTKNVNNSNTSKKIFLSKNNSIYFNIYDISPIDKKKESDECLKNIKLILGSLN